MASRFFKASKHSQGQERSLNWFVTLNLSHTNATPQQSTIVQSNVCARFSRWLRHQSKKAIAHGKESYGAPTYQAVVENPSGVHHIHWLVHIPDELVALFERTLPKWLDKAAGGITLPHGAIDIRPIDTVMALSRYCMKGVDIHHARRCYVNPTDQGIVWGKRVAISRSLGPTARSKAAAVSRSYVTGSALRTSSGTAPGPASAWTPT